MSQNFEYFINFLEYQILCRNTLIGIIKTYIIGGIDNEIDN